VATASLQHLTMNSVTTLVTSHNTSRNGVLSRSIPDVRKGRLCVLYKVISSSIQVKVGELPQVCAGSSVLCDVISVVTEFMVSELRPGSVPPL
jgi:hypothetical protein